MIALPRQRPDTIPAIHPLPEYLASGQRAIWYAEMKHALQVPWMGVVTMAFAHYPSFFGELWRGLKPLSESTAFVDACRALRAEVEQRSAGLAPQNLVAALARHGYAPREIDALRDANTVFSHGNPPYLLIATLARHLLELGDLAGKASAEPFTGRHAPEVSVPLVLMEAHHADAPTQAIYADIKTTLDLPFVNTDYRAFARWPSYFALAWNDLRDIVGTPAHEAVCQACHDQAAALVAALPNPGALSATALRQAAEADAPIDEVMEVCRLFQWLLPGLMTNVAYFRHQLEDR